jgi:hypothetical protein
MRLRLHAPRLRNPALLRGRHKASKGVGVVMVLGVLSITLALSYALLRTQAVTAQVNANYQRIGDARQAALTALADGLRTMHLSGWQGAETSYEKQLGDDAWYTIAYATGDPSLLGADGEVDESHPDAQSYPWRVTINATGFAAAPNSSESVVSHSASLVVQLVPRQRSAPVGDWSYVRRFTLYQWSTQTTAVQFPVHVKGPVRLHGPLEMCEDYPTVSAQVDRYLNDLRRIKNDFGTDWRPFSGPVAMRRSLTHNTSLSRLESKLGVVTENTSATNPLPASHPGTVLEYRLYPGGKTYSIPSLNALHGSTLSEVSLAADPATNPLGVFRTTSNVTFGNNVAFKGVLIGGGASDLRLIGSGVQLEGPTLPALPNETQPVRLPLALIPGDVEIQTEFKGSLRGQVIAWDEFDVQKGQSSVELDAQGQILARAVSLAGRSNWDISQSWWNFAYGLFEAQLDHHNALTYFPLWVQGFFGFQAQPKIVIQPDPSNPQFHYQNWSQPVIVPHPDDEGLVWEVVSWSEGGV